jgi:hypothetical protein
VLAIGGWRGLVAWVGGVGWWRGLVASVGGEGRRGADGRGSTGSYQRGAIERRMIQFVGPMSSSGAAPWLATRPFTCDAIRDAIRE